MARIESSAAPTGGARWRVLVVPGSSFNIDDRTHFRVTLLPEPDTLDEVFRRIERLLDG